MIWFDLDQSVVLYVCWFCHIRLTLYIFNEELRNNADLCVSSIGPSSLGLYIRFDT